MTAMDDLADKAAAQLCTENTEAVEDWADEDPMTWYIRANALSLEDGTMNITYFEGEDGLTLLAKMHQYIHLRLHYGLKNGMTVHTIIFHSEQQGDPAIIRMRGMWIRK